MPYAICDTCGERNYVAGPSLDAEECPNCASPVKPTGRFATGRARLRHHTAVIDDFVKDLIGRRQPE